MSNLNNIDVQLVAKDVCCQFCLPYEYTDIAREVIMTGKGYILVPNFVP